MVEGGGWMAECSQASTTRRRQSGQAGQYKVQGESMGRQLIGQLAVGLGGGGERGGDASQILGGKKAVRGNGGIVQPTRKILLELA